MAAHLTEEEQIQALKYWWERYGKISMSAVVLAAAGYLGFSLWHQHKASIAADASQQYDQFAKLIKTEPGKPISAEQKNQAKTLGEQMAAQHPNTHYAHLALLAMAKLAVDDNDLTTAATHLRAVVQAPADAPTHSLAQLRLAKVLAAQNNLDEALLVLNSTPAEGFESLFAEAKGDALLTANRLPEALTAYQAALTALDKTPSQEAAMRKSLLQFKLDSAREPGSKKPENPLMPEGHPSATPEAGAQ